MISFVISTIMTLIAMTIVATTFKFIDIYILLFGVPTLVFYPLARMTQAIMGEGEKELKQLNDIYLAIPRWVKYILVKLFSPFKFFLIGAQYVLDGILWAFKKYLSFLMWIATKVFDAVKGVGSLLVKFVQKPLEAVAKFMYDLADWVVNKLDDYVIKVVTFIFQLFFFQVQELLNSFIKSAFGIFRLPPLEVIDLPKEFIIFKF